MALKTLRQKTDLPLFLESEKREADLAISSLLLHSANLYHLRLINLDAAGVDLEEIAATYLLTNAVLMSRTPRRIAKFVSFDVSDIGVIYSYANTLRSILRGEFTSLAQIDTWKRTVARKWTLPTDLLVAVDEAVRFFESSGISSTSSSFHRASISLGVEKIALDALEGGEFTVDASNIFVPKLVGVTQSYEVALTDIYAHDGLTLSLGLGGRHVVVELDCASLNSGVAGWLANLKHLLAKDLFRVGHTETRLTQPVLMS